MWSACGRLLQVCCQLASVDDVVIERWRSSNRMVNGHCKCRACPSKAEIDRSRKHRPQRRVLNGDGRHAGAVALMLWAVSCQRGGVVEQGSRDATPTITAAVAKALGVDVTSLTGQPYNEHGRRRDRIHALIPALCRALTYWDLPPELPTPPRSWPELEAAARTGVGPTRIEPDRRPWLRPPPLPESCCTCSHGRYWPGRYPPDGFLAAAAVPGPM